MGAPKVPASLGVKGEVLTIMKDAQHPITAAILISCFSNTPGGSCPTSVKWQSLEVLSAVTPGGAALESSRLILGVPLILWPGTGQPPPHRTLSPKCQWCGGGDPGSRHTPASGPWHLLLPLPRKLLSQTCARLIPSRYLTSVQMPGLPSLHIPLP